MLVEKMKQIKSSYDLDFDPRELHYQASREAADISFHYEIKKKLNSEISLISQIDKGLSVNDQSIIIVD